MDAATAIDTAASKGAPTKLVHAWRGMAAEGDPAGAAAAAKEWLHGQGMVRKMTAPLAGLAAAPAVLIAGNPYLTGALVVAALIGGSYWLASRRESRRQPPPPPYS